MSWEISVSMDTKQKFVQTYLFSTVGVLGMLVLLVAANAIFRGVNSRLDLTEEKLYTLSQGTKSILAKIDTPVTLRFYFSKDVNEMPVDLKSYAQRVDDLLKEYREASKGNILIEHLNPKPDSDAEDSANLDGVRGQSVGVIGGDSIYLGIAVSCLDETASLPFLSPDREDWLEYDITRAIYRVFHPEKPVVGVMSSLPVMGQQAPMNPMMPNPQGQQPPWQIITELKADFDVREVQKDADEIDGDVNILILIHATDLSDKTLFAIDQFVLRGGKLMAFLDPMSLIEQQNSPMSQFQRRPPSVSTLGKLLDAWGVEFETEKVVADLEYMARIRRGPGPAQAMPTFLSLTKEALDADDPVTGQLDNVLFAFGGIFTGDAAAGLQKTVLMHTSEKSQLVEKFMAQMSGEHIIKEFKSDDKERALAIRLTGKFKTAFPNGKPAGGEDDAKKDDSEGAGKFLTEAAQDGAVVLVGDSDMIYDHFCIQRQQNFLGQQIVNTFNDNLAFAQSATEHLSGDSSLIGIRSRGAISRPFTVVRKMQAEAEQRWQDQIKALEEDVQDAQRKISELQREKSKDQRFVLSQEQKETLEKLREQKAERNKELKKVRKQFRRDIDALETWCELANIALMPALVVIMGMLIAFVKRRRMTA